jgi:hypothetical protein
LRAAVCPGAGDAGGGAGGAVEDLTPLGLPPGHSGTQLTIDVERKSGHALAFLPRQLQLALEDAHVRIAQGKPDARLGCTPGNGHVHLHAYQFDGQLPSRDRNACRGFGVLPGAGLHRLRASRQGCHGGRQRRQRHAP